MKKRLVVLVLGLVTSFAAADPVGYDTEFLDADGYTGTNINGQAGWTVLRVGTAPIETVANRTDGLLTMTPTYATNVAYSVAKHATNVDSVSSFVAKTSMKYASTAGAYGAFYLENTGTSGNLPKVLVDGISGFLCFDNGTPTQLIPKVNVSSDTWYNVEMTIDLVSKTYDLAVTPRGGSTVTASGLGFSSAFATFDTVTLGGGHYNTDTSQPYDAAVFDYVEIAVPEPATMSLVVLGGLAMLRRRRSA